MASNKTPPKNNLAHVLGDEGLALAQVEHLCDEAGGPVCARTISEIVHQKKWGSAVTWNRLLLAINLHSTRNDRPIYTRERLIGRESYSHDVYWEEGAKQGAPTGPRRTTGAPALAGEAA